jgi:predicted membrane metal-binding protein
LKFLMLFVAPILLAAAAWWILQSLDQLSFSAVCVAVGVFGLVPLAALSAIRRRRRRRLDGMRDSALW